MRSFLLFLVIIIVTPTALILPHLGVLVWTWMSVMSPHQLSWGFTYGIPFILIIAVVTLTALLFSKEPKLPPSRLLMWAALAFVIQTTISSYAALQPEISWPLWERNAKTFILFFATATLIRSKVRIQAMLWIIAISLGYFATTGVIGTLSSGGNTVLSGPPSSMLTDNNHIALALVTLLPILNYLRISSDNPLVRTAITAVIAFTLIAVVTSYSRGALLALAVGGLAFLRSAKGRVVILTLMAVVGLVAVSLMPEEWRDRVMTLESVESVQEDKSFSGRLDAWYVSWKLATMRPLTGGGYSSIESLATFARFKPEATRGRAAHSMYFQVLGDHGFVGLVLYLLMIIAAALHLRRARTATRRRPELAWANQLATMLEISLLVFCVGGAALSVAYIDLILLLLVISMNLDIAVSKLLVKKT